MTSYVGYSYGAFDCFFGFCAVLCFLITFVVFFYWFELEYP